MVFRPAIIPATVHQIPGKVADSGGILPVHITVAFTKGVRLKTAQGMALNKITRTADNLIFFPVLQPEIL